MGSKSNYDIFLELIHDYEPCVLVYYGDTAVPYKVTLSLTEPDTYQLIDPVTNKPCGTVGGRDPNVRYFCTDGLRRSVKTKLYTIVTLPDGSQKEFSDARDALVSGAVEEHIAVHSVTAEAAVSHILLDLEDTGSNASNVEASLKSLKDHLNIDDPCDTYLYEFYDKRNAGKIVRHYFVMDSYVTHYVAIRALMHVAEVFGWKVEVEERPE